ncbi:MAG: AI-2E family transporter [Acidimicrobiia bacterium]
MPRSIPGDPEGPHYGAAENQGTNVTEPVDTSKRDHVPDAAPTKPSLKIEIDGKIVWQVIVAVLLTMIAIWAFDQASHLITLVAISFFFSLALQPAVMMLTNRYEWRRGAAVGVIYASGFVGLILLIVVLIPAIAVFAKEVGLHGAEWVQSLLDWVHDTFGWTLPDGGFDGDSATDFEDELQEWAKGAFGNVLGVATSGLGFVFDMATILMFTFYFTADAPRFQRSVLGLMSPDAQERLGWTWDQAIIQTGGYFYSRLLLMAINSVGFFFTMVVVGVPVLVALPLALFGAFVAAFIPAIGTYLGSAVPILVTLALSGIIGALIVLAYAIIYQQIENYWLSPKISANTMTLNGAVAFGAALAGGAIAGPMGAFVALPVAALITAFISNFAQHNEVVYNFEYEDHSSDVEETESTSS